MIIMGFEIFSQACIGSVKGIGSGMRASGEGLASFFNMFRK